MYKRQRVLCLKGGRQNYLYIHKHVSLFIIIYLLNAGNFFMLILHTNIGVVTGGAAGALAPPLSDMGGQEYVCAPPLNVEQNHSYVEIILNHYNSSHFMANLFYFQQQLSKHFS